MVWHLLGSLLCLAGVGCVLVSSPRAAFTGWFPMAVGALSMAGSITAVRVPVVVWLPALLGAALLAAAGADRVMAMHRAFALLALVPLHLTIDAGSGAVAGVHSPEHHAAGGMSWALVTVVIAAASTVAGVAALRMRRPEGLRVAGAGGPPVVADASPVALRRAPRIAGAVEPPLMMAALGCMLMATLA
jgi:hypothetical protein